MTGQGSGAATTPESLRDRIAAGLTVRMMQVAFTALLVLDVACRVLARGEVGAWPMVAVGMILVAAAVVALRDPPSHAPGPTAGIVCALDIGGVGLTMAGLAPGAATGALLVFPATWLGVSYAARGVAGAVGAVALAGSVLPRLNPAGYPAGPLDAVVLSGIAGVTAAGCWSLTRWALGRGELAQQRAQALTIVLDTVDVGVMVLDPTGRVVTSNGLDEIFRRHGHPDGFSGLERQPRLTMTRDGRPLTHEERPTVRALAGEEFDDYRMWVGDGEERVGLSISARSVRDAAGQQVGAVLATRDITSFERALRTRDTFVAALSHELRTPLTALLGYAHLLAERGDLSPEAREEVAAVSRNGDRLGRLVSDLVHTATLERNQLALRVSEQDLAAIVAGAVDRVSAVARGREVTLHVDASSAIPAAVDPVGIGNVVEGLVLRAVARSPRGGVVDVWVGAEDGRIELYVFDEGRPLDARSRVQALRQPSSAGGIEEARAVVEAHGGRIELDPANCPAADDGGVVCVRLPARRVTEVA